MRFYQWAIYCCCLARLFCANTANKWIHSVIIMRIFRRMQMSWTVFWMDREWHSFRKYNFKYNISLKIILWKRDWASHCSHRIVRLEYMNTSAFTHVTMCQEPYPINIVGCSSSTSGSKQLPLQWEDLSKTGNLPLWHCWGALFSNSIYLTKSQQKRYNNLHALYGCRSFVIAQRLAVIVWACARCCNKSETRWSLYTLFGVYLFRHNIR